MITDFVSSRIPSRWQGRTSFVQPFPLQGLITEQELNWQRLGKSRFGSPSAVGRSGRQDLVEPVQQW
jgi:hypothetical protein